MLSQYSDDIRSSATENQQWDFAVESNITGEMVTVKFEGLQEITNDLTIYLADATLGYKQDLRANPVYQFPSRGLAHPKKLSLLVGKAAYIAEETARFAGVPENFVLYQNSPNPFNPETTIRFGLPKRSFVTLKIFDITGREVVTLFEHAEYAEGSHQVLWTGRNQAGNFVSSGIYFCRLTGQGFSRKMKMALVK